MSLTVPVRANTWRCHATQYVSVRATSPRMTTGGFLLPDEERYSAAQSRQHPQGRFPMLESLWSGGCQRLAKLATSPGLKDDSGRGRGGQKKGTQGMPGQ